MNPLLPNKFLAATAVHRHPDVDLAVVVLPDHEVHAGDQFYDSCPDMLIDGGDFQGFGYPIGEGQAPVGRLIKGHFQRYLSFDAPTGDSYFAGEMSVPVSGGLSGSILTYVPTDKPRAVAVATTSIESSVTVDSFEETQHDGSVYKETIKRVTTFGVALMLHGHQEWLKSVMSA